MDNFGSTTGMNSMHPHPHSHSPKVPQLQAGRRRRFTEQEKRDLLTEAFTANETVSELGRRYGIAVGLLFRWKRQLGVTRASVSGTSQSDSLAKSPEGRLEEMEGLLASLVNQNRTLQDRLERLETGKGSDLSAELLGRSC